MADIGGCGQDFEHCSDILPCLKRSIFDSLKSVEEIVRSRIGLCSLKFNKKRLSGDLIVPAIVRTCFAGDHVAMDNEASIQRLCEKIINCLSTIKFLKHCQLTSGGHLLLTLNKPVVTNAVIYNVLSKGDQFGKLSEENSQSVLLNPSLFWSSCAGDQENFNLDQLRTLLVCEHTKELLQANGVSVKLMPYDCQTIQSKPGNIQIRKEICHLFTSSYTSNSADPSTGKDLVRKTKELREILQGCKYANQIESIESTETESTCNQTTTDVCEGECCCKNLVLDLEEFLKDSKLAHVSVILSCSLLKGVAKLDLSAGKGAASANTLLHVTSCRRTYLQQQVSTVWQMASQTPLSGNQLNLTHGLVSVHNAGEKLQGHVDAMDLLRIREKQLRESYVLKYGDKVEGHGWEASIKQMAVAVIKLEILSVAPNSEVKINLCESSREFRQATFVLYNCARLAKLFQNFEENVRKGEYPALPPVKEVDFNLLRDEAEWELVLNFILAFPSIVKDTVPTIAAKSQSVTIHTNKICCFLFTLSHKFSSYYGRVHILGESRQHLFPTMFARLYLMKAIQQIFLNCLKLLNVSSLTQM